MGNTTSEKEKFETCEKLSFAKCLEELKLIKQKKYDLEVLEEKVQKMNTWRLLNSFPMDKMTEHSRRLFNKLEAERRHITLWIFYAENFSH
jgi:3-methyladenine DNA glycosylase AlkD